MAQDGDIVFTIGAEVQSLIRGGQQGERALADLEREAKKLERELGKIGTAGVEFQREMNKLTGVTREMGKSARDSAAAFEAFDRSRQQVDNLRASIDPLFAASKRYEQALQTLDAALEQGAISARQHAAMTDMVSASMLRADGASAAMGGRLGLLGGMSDQTRGKIQQAGFQIQDFAVQVGAGTSATQAFAQQFPQMAGAFGPWGVALGTAAAILVPLGAAFFAASQEADKLTEAMERQKVVSDALVQAAQRLRLEREMQSSGAQFAEEQQALEEIAATEAKRRAILNDLVLLQDEEGRGTNAILANKRYALNQELQALDARKRYLQELLRTLEAERQKTAASENARKIAEAYRAIQQQIASADISGPWKTVLGSIQNAIDKAREYAREMPSGQTMAPAVPFYAGQTVDGIMPPQLGLITDTGDGDGGGGNGGGANPMLAQVEQLRQQLMTEEQIEMESHAKRQEMLQHALDQKLLTQQEYAALMEQAQSDHAARMTDIDVWRYGTGLDKAQAFFSGMAGALQGGSERMLAISKKFAAAEALINAWKGFSDVLADKSLPWFAKIPQAAAVLKAGLGAVNAIKGGGGAGSGGGGRGQTAAAAAAPQQNVQTLNFTLTNDRFGFGEGIVRQIAAQLNEAQRNGSTLIRANVT